MDGRERLINYMADDAQKKGDKIAELNDRNTTLGVNLTTLQAEVERYREALKKLAKEVDENKRLPAEVDILADNIRCIIEQALESEDK